jgi:DNA-binding response OmpR family regulator
MPEESKKKVLIAEDEQAMAGVLTHKFNAEGIEVLHVSTGDLVVPSLQKEHFDLVLLDLMMPEMDGFEVLRQMQQLNLTTPVVVLSNLGQTEDVLKVKAYGAKDYIIKSSVTPAEILARVEVYLK